MAALDLGREIIQMVMRRAYAAPSGSTGVAHFVREGIGHLERAGFADVPAQDFVPGVLVRVCGLKRA